MGVPELEVDDLVSMSWWQTLHGMGQHPVNFSQLCQLIHNQQGSVSLGHNGLQFDDLDKVSPRIDWLVVQVFLDNLGCDGSGIGIPVEEILPAFIQCCVAAEMDGVRSVLVKHDDEFPLSILSRGSDNISPFLIPIRKLEDVSLESWQLPLFIGSKLGIATQSK